jgi:hypothetical protein
MATAITLAPVSAEAQHRGGAGASVGRGGAAVGGRGFSAGPRVGGAAPLTISRNTAYVRGGYPYGGYRYGGDRYGGGYRYAGGYYGGPYYDGGWFPGLLAAPFLLTGALLGAGAGYGYDYPYGGGSYYAPAAYGGDIGNYCATPQKVCLLTTPAPVSIGCSCRAPGGGRFRGSVVP